MESRSEASTTVGRRMEAKVEVSEVSANLNCMAVALS